jgi:hypothetical protein
VSFVIVPTEPTAPFWVQTTTLDGVPYLLTFRFNFREQVYYLDIVSADGLVFYAEGLKLVSNFLLLRTYGVTPPGELMAVSSSSDDSPAKIGELGDGLRVALIYIPQADLIAAGMEPHRNPNLTPNQP